MTYLGFLLTFVAPPIVILLAVTRPTRRELLALGALLAAAYLWTTPWDNYLVGSGVWFYDPRLVSGIALGWVPLEEYLYFGLQTVLAGLWTIALARRLPAGPGAVPQAALLAGLPAAGLWASVPAGATAGVPAADLPALQFGAWNYTILILAWAGPVIVGQIWLGWGTFKARWRVWLAGILGPAVYLTAIDAVALQAGTWSIAPGQSLGLFLPGGVPIEEALFFLVTTTLVVQGLLLFTSPAVEARFRRRPRA